MLASAPVRRGSCQRRSPRRLVGALLWAVCQSAYMVLVYLRTALRSYLKMIHSTPMITARSTDMMMFTRRFVGSSSATDDTAAVL